LVQDRDGAELYTGGILLYVEDLKRGTNKDIGPKDIFEMGSNENSDFPDKQVLLLIFSIQDRKYIDISYLNFLRCRYRNLYDVFPQKKDADGVGAHLRVSGQNRSDGAVGSAQGAGSLKRSQSAGGL
jgi:hypothetical protein